MVFSLKYSSKLFPVVFMFFDFGLGNKFRSIRLTSFEINPKKSLYGATTCPPSLVPPQPIITHSSPSYTFSPAWYWSLYSFDDSTDDDDDAFHDDADHGDKNETCAKGRGDT